MRKQFDYCEILFEKVDYGKIRGMYLDSGWCGVELSGTVVRYPDAVNSVLHRGDGVLNGHHTLHNDLHCCVLSIVKKRR